MAIKLDKYKFHNTISLTMQLIARVQCAQKISDLILKKNWPRNDTNVKDDPL
jgi:hypothetical protein